MKKFFMMLAIVASCAMFASCGAKKDENKAADATEQKDGENKDNNGEELSEYDADVQAVANLMLQGQAAVASGDTETAEALEAQFTAIVDKYEGNEQFATDVMSLLNKLTSGEVEEVEVEEEEVTFDEPEEEPEVVADEIEAEEVEEL